jgi:hypothetical protein
MDILEREPIGVLATEATGRLHPGGAEGRVGALAVVPHWLQYEEERQEKAEVIRRGGGDAFTEDDFF